MDKVYYYNHKGILALTINEAPYFMKAETGEFKNHSFGYDQLYGRFRNFYRNKESYPFSIIVTSSDLADFDALCDIFNEDVLAGEPGYFLINGWKLNCMVISAEHQFYGLRDNVIDFTAVSENPVWQRRSSRSFDGTAAGMDPDVDYGRDYIYREAVLGRDYNYGYNLSDGHYAVLELSGTDNGYEVTIYGPQDDPVIYLDNYPIKINTSIDETQRIRITSNGSSERTVKILASDGTETDAFIYRDKENSPFITLGERTELTYGAVRFDFTTIERRSEPSWT